MYALGLTPGDYHLFMSLQVSGLCALTKINDGCSAKDPQPKKFFENNIETTPHLG